MLPAFPPRRMPCNMDGRNPCKNSHIFPATELDARSTFLQNVFQHDARGTYSVHLSAQKMRTLSGCLASNSDLCSSPRRINNWKWRCISPRLWMRADPHANNSSVGTASIIESIKPITLLIPYLVGRFCAHWKEFPD
ncbi:hypothetical protein AFCA_013338 [Aspergillus flavus]|nr:hypothetical protein AFCA_013338 [Aspergillus flavus]